MTPLALARIGCAQCHGLGLRRSGRRCACVDRRVAALIAAAGNIWERLWVEAALCPDRFPSRPLPRSSLCPDYLYRLPPR